MESEKQSFRQRWFPNMGDSEEAGSDKWYGDVGCFFGRWARTAVVGATLSWLTIWGGCNIAGNNFEYSEGARTGMINKFTKKGLIWKTYEGEMALEGMVSGENYSGANVWDFSLDREARHGEKTEALVKKIQGYLDTGTKVKVTYTEPFITWPWRSGTNYLIQNVEPIKSAKIEKE